MTNRWGRRIRAAAGVAIAAFAAAPAAASPPPDYLCHGDRLAVDAMRYVFYAPSAPDLPDAELAERRPATEPYPAVDARGEADPDAFFVFETKGPVGEAVFRRGEERFVVFAPGIAALEAEDRPITPCRGLGEDIGGEGGSIDSRVLAGGVNVRAAPTTKARILRSLQPGDAFLVDFAMSAELEGRPWLLGRAPSEDGEPRFGYVWSGALCYEPDARGGDRRASGMARCP